MEDEDKTKTELIKELKIFREERGEILLNSITENKQVEEKLINLEGLFKIVFDYAPDACYINDSGSPGWVYRSDTQYCMESNLWGCFAYKLLCLWSI